MTRFMNEIESQKEQINELVAQIKKQDELFQKYQEENLKNQEILASFESKMMKFEAAMNEKYREEQEKNKQSHEKQLETIKKLEEKNELQEKRIKELEDIFRILKENQMTCEIQASTQQDQTIKGVININECGSQLDRSRSKYLLSTDESPTLGRKSYEEGSQIEHLRQEVTFMKAKGRYYLHALLTDIYGHEKEFVSQAVSTNGIQYIYNFTGRAEAVTLPTGRYRLEVWGAEGGKNNEFSNHSGKGGYSVGTLTLNKATKLFIHVGECPNGLKGGWNGGGSAKKYKKYTPAGGGGATDISLYGEEGSSNWNNEDHLYSRIIVAGAGGGSSHDNDYPHWYGGFGGGLAGQISGFGINDSEGTQTRAGQCQSCSEGQGFGVGGTFVDTGSSGGGSGWYGGGAPGRGNWGVGGSGGSGYVYNQSTASNYPSGCKLNSEFYLAESKTVSGDQQIPNPANSSKETGHSGHGYARITLL
ncbi:hypothetical protein M9Y10_010634 [Tritrichomonas musculus]|uniref:receptor protein-tyrosine kinase n=1 Tax=Tritrichomonas musculus TaxID=1915356 RepID=A0ABR2GM75_9EUKA